MTPILTVLLILALIALGFTIGAAVGKLPIWIAVLFLCIIELIRVLPLGK